MRLDLEKLKETGGRFAHVYAVNDLSFEDADLQLTDPVTVRGHVRQGQGEAKLEGELQTRLSVDCGRCLKRVELPVNIRFEERFVPSVAWRAEEQHELQPEDLNLSVFDGEAIDLDDLVKEEIVLALPSQVVCRDECQGLCPTCGIDRNTGSCDCETGQIDSRWAKLKDMQF